MTACVLSEENIREIKAALRINHPSVRSAHATEAIARAFGFNTNAAMIAALNSHAGKIGLVGKFDRSACQARLRELASATTLELKCFDQEEFAKFAAWKMLPSRDNLSRAFNEWHAECGRLAIPCVSVSARTKLAKVKWDLITLPYETEASIRRNAADEVVRTLYDAFCRISKSRGPHPKAIFQGTTYYGYVDNLPVAVAAEVAEQFCLLLHHEILQRCRM